MARSVGWGSPGGLSFAEEADIRGGLYWGDVIDGTPVNTARVAKANQARYLRNDTPLMPLAPAIPDDIIWKAIFDYGGADVSKEDYHEQTEKLRTEMVKGFDTEYAAITKATTSGVGSDSASTANSTGSSMIHAIADEKIAYLYKRPYPIQALIPTESNRGKAAVWDSIGPFDFGSAAFGTEDESFTESDVTAYTRTEYIKFLYSVGRVTKAAQLSGLSAVPPRDMMAVRVDAAQDALRALRERAMLGVSVDVQDKTPTFNASTPTNGYPGIYNFLANNSTTADQNYVDGTGVSTYKEIMEYLDTSYNAMVIDSISPNLAICDYTTFGTIRRGLTEYFRTDPVQTFTQGVSKISLVFPNEGGLPLVPHPFLPQTSGSGAIFMVDTRLMARRSLWMDTYEDLAKINLSQKFVVSAAETFIDKSDVDGSTSLMGGVINLN